MKKKILTNKTIEKLLKQIFSINKEENESKIEDFIDNKQIKMGEQKKTKTINSTFLHDPTSANHQSSFIENCRHLTGVRLCNERNYKVS